MKQIDKEQIDKEWEQIEKGIDFSKKGLEEYTELEQLKALKEIIKNCWYIACNNNDYWAWALAGACSIDVGFDLDKLLLAKLKYGIEGEFALFSIVEGYEQPQEPWFERGYLNKEKFFEARKWILENMPPTDESGTQTIEDEIKVKFYEYFKRTDNKSVERDETS